MSAWAWFLVIAVLLGAAALACVVVPLWRDRGRPSSTAALTACSLLIPALAIFVYFQSSNYQWAHAGLDAEEGGPAPTLEQLIEPLRLRLEQSPEDPQGWMLLGVSYSRVGRYPEAVEAFDRVLTLTGGQDVDALMGKAEALILEKPENLLGEAGDMVEQVLAADPANPSGLWYGGLRASAAGEQITAVRRWRTMLEGSLTPEVRTIVERELARLGAMPAGSQSVAAEGPVELRLRLGPSASPAPGAVLFIVARIPGQAGPPLAARRLDGARFPVDVSLGDSDAMLPGAKISDQSELAITARLSASGQTTRGPGDYEAQGLWQTGQGPLEMELLFQP